MARLHRSINTSLGQCQLRKIRSWIEQAKGSGTRDYVADLTVTAFFRRVVNGLVVLGEMDYGN